MLLIGLESALCESSSHFQGELDKGMKLIIGTPAGRKSRVSMLPLLTGLFVISYGMLTTLVVLQDRTIDSQRSLIHVLFQDSLKLSAMKTRPAANAMNKPAKEAAGKSVQAPTSQAAPRQEAQAQVVPDPALPKQIPSAEAKPPVNGKTRNNSRKAEKPLPMRPPAEVTDPSDMRRATFSI